MTGSRYDRQAALPGFGPGGQGRLRRARVLVLGAGGLGSPVLAYLAGAGVGHLVVVDGDGLDRTNLHRQVIYADQEVGGPKAVLAAAFVRRLNPDVAVTAVVRDVPPEGLAALVQGSDLVLDCSDNLPTRYALNRACVGARVPYVWAAVGRYSGRCSTVLPGSPCFECLLGPQHAQPAPEPASAAGIFGPVCGMLGATAASEAIKVLTGAGRPLVGRLSNVDLLTGDCVVVDLAGDPACAACDQTLDTGSRLS
ncbi:MAG: HesA/MoeB/ThiF family protein [Micrococcales bacterium]|nr:HesA/MoeB/ThiF family protein [Micrococcales bacterium]